MKFFVYLFFLSLTFTSSLAFAKTHTIVIEAMTYTPADLEVKTGDVVEWVNKDFFPHTATSKKNFDSGVIVAGASWKHTAKSKGKFEYVCTLHPSMKAVLKVK